MKDKVIMWAIFALMVVDCVYIVGQSFHREQIVVRQAAEIAGLREQVAEVETELAVAHDENEALQGELAEALDMLEDPNSLFGGGLLELTPDEEQELMQIAMAEARGQGIIGKALVMRTVINRVERDEKSVHEVIFSPNQFHTAGMSEPDEECEIALLMVAAGWDGSQGACYFCNSGYNGSEPLFKFKGHYFSK